MQKFEKLFLVTSMLPNLFFAGVWLWVSSIQGYGAFGAVWALMVPIFLTALYAIIGLVMLLIKFKSHEKIDMRLWMATIANWVIPLALIFRLIYLDI